MSEFISISKKEPPDYLLVELLCDDIIDEWQCFGFRTTVSLDGCDYFQQDCTWITPVVTHWREIEK